MPWLFDPNHTQVEYACRYLGLSVIKGSFDAVRADVDFESADPREWSVSAEIDAASAVSPGFARRIEALRAENFLDAEKFPTITFRSTSFEPQGNELRLTGQLTLHGVTREITLTGHDNGEAIDRRGIKRRGFDAHTVIKRRDFGIDPTGTVGVAEDVDISLEVQLIWEEPDGAQPAA